MGGISQSEHDLSSGESFYGPKEFGLEVCLKCIYIVNIAKA